ncbi:MAG: hypothetical protein R6V23_10440, partial [Bacteroidales bacterium]
GQIADRNPEIANGDGFAFGANTSFETGRKTYSIFYGEFSALAGFDMSLLNYTREARCEGMEGPLGINGWYASGQIYSALSASIGLHVDLWFTEGNYEILNLNGGAILQGSGPNPTWLSGNVGGHYRILKGKVKGYCDFHFSMGDRCEMVQENPLSRIDLISDIAPVKGSTDVEVMLEPQVVSTFELNEPFELQEMPSGGGSPEVRTFKVKLKDFDLRKSSTNDSVPGRMNLSPDKFSAYYSSHDMLAGNTNYKLDVAAYGEEYIDGIWEPAVKNDGSLITQSESTNFKTGAAPDKIEKHHVAYSYPIYEQRFFLQDECRSGKVRLKTGMPHLFVQTFGYDMELIARFIPALGEEVTKEVPFTYNSGSKSLRFDVPDLQNNTLYFVQFVKKQTLKQTADQEDTDRKKGNESDENTTTRKREKIVDESGSDELIIEERMIFKNRVRESEKILYAYLFRTSKYNTLQAKLNSFNYIVTNSEFHSNNMEVHKAVYEGDESFGYYDLHPVEWNKSGAVHTFGPLLKVRGSERTATWHNQFVNPEVYDNISWMNSKGWWNNMTQFDDYAYSPNKDLVALDRNSDYEPVSVHVSELIPQTFSIGSSDSGEEDSSTSSLNSTSLSVSGSGSSFSTIGNFGSTTSTSSSGSMSGVSFEPGSASGSNLNNLQIDEFPTPNIIVTYNHGKVVPADFVLLRNKATEILSRWYIPKSGTERVKLNSIINTNYVPMFRGNYPLKFYYNYNGCLGVDEDKPKISKPFIY